MKSINLAHINMGTVAKVLRDKNAIFVQNGEPAQVFCHQRQKAVGVVTRAGHLCFKWANDLKSPLPQMDEAVVFVRESQDPKAGKSFTQGAFWFDKDEWDHLSWVLEAQKRYRVIATNHRRNGEELPNFTERRIIWEDTLIGLVAEHPCSSTADGLEGSRESSIGKLKLTSDVIWEVEGSDGKWTRCADPRPVDFQFE